MVIVESSWKVLCKWKLFFRLPTSRSLALDFHFKIFHIEYEDVFGILDIWIEYKCKCFFFFEEHSVFS